MASSTARMKTQLREFARQLDDYVRGWHRRVQRWLKARMARAEANQ